VLARKVVLALGREGSGATQWPAFPSFVAGKSNTFSRVAHANDATIDFTAWKGKHVGVLGAGASAFDNAASALEAGAVSATLFMRRPHLPQVNKSKWTAFAGCLRGFQSLEDEMRWRFYTYILDEQVPPPYESVLRCDRFTGCARRFGEPWLDIVASENGVAVTTSKAEHRFDAVIIATGFDVDVAARLELAAIRSEIALWADRVTSQEAKAHPEAARFPYLGDGFQLSARVPDAPLAASLANIHVFNWGATMSHGPLAGDIPGLAVGATRLANAIARDLFRADAGQHYAALQALEEPELQLTRYFVPPALR
jgi:cation diffusion facilitator CzcD-associated flavoprotein CzcO